MSPRPAVEGERSTRRVLLAIFAVQVMLAAYVGCLVWSVGVLVDAFSALGTDAEVLGLVMASIVALLAVPLFAAFFQTQALQLPGAIVVTRQEEPGLWTVLDDTADRIGATRVHEVLLTPGTRVGVVSDISMLGLVLPPKGHVHLGLGLLNVLSISELAAAIAPALHRASPSSAGSGGWALLGVRALPRALCPPLTAAEAGLVGRALSLPVWAVRTVLWATWRALGPAWRPLEAAIEAEAQRVPVDVLGADDAVSGAIRQGRDAEVALAAATAIALDLVDTGHGVWSIYALQTLLLTEKRRRDAALLPPDQGRGTIGDPSDPESLPASGLLADSEARFLAASRATLHPTVAAASPTPPLAEADLALLVTRLGRSPRLEPSLRGIYDERSCVMASAEPEALLAPAPVDVVAALARLYPSSLVSAVLAWRTAQAHDDRVRLEEPLLEHDRAARAAHRAAAAQMDGGWSAYLERCLGAVHYFEHRAKNLRSRLSALRTWTDAHPEPLSAAANQERAVLSEALFLVLATVHADADLIRLSAPAHAALGTNWAGYLGRCTLARPTAATVGAAWSEAAETQAAITLRRLDRAAGIALDSLITGEADVRRAFQAGSALGAAPELSLPPRRPVDSAVAPEPRPAGPTSNVFRLTTACCILTPLVVLADRVGSAEVLVYNGLGIPVVVSAGGVQRRVAPAAVERMRLRRTGALDVKTRDDAGSTIEQFTASLTTRAMVYNVADADVLYAASATYGVGTPTGAHPFDPGRWYAPKEELVFEDPPPELVLMNGNPARLTVLEAAGDLDAGRIHGSAGADRDRRAELTRTHVAWDPLPGDNWFHWVKFALDDGTDVIPTLRARLARDPRIEVRRVLKDLDHRPLESEPPNPPPAE